MHGGIDRHHGVGHEVAGLVGVKAAVDRAAVDVTPEPSGVGPRPGSRDAVKAGIQSRTADGIDSRFAEDNRFGVRCGDGKETGIPP